MKTSIAQSRIFACCRIFACLHCATPLKVAWSAKRSRLFQFMYCVPETQYSAWKSSTSIGHVGVGFQTAINSAVALEWDPPFIREAALSAWLTRTNHFLRRRWDNQAYNNQQPQSPTQLHNTDFHCHPDLCPGSLDARHMQVDSDTG